MRDGCSGVADDGVRMQCELVYPYREYLLATEIRVRFDLLCMCWAVATEVRPERAGRNEGLFWRSDADCWRTIRQTPGCVRHDPADVRSRSGVQAQAIE